MNRFAEKTYGAMQLQRGRVTLRLLKSPAAIWRLLRSSVISNKMISISVCRATWRRGASPLFFSIGGGVVDAECLQCNHNAKHEWVGIKEASLYGFARNHLFGDCSKDPYKDYLLLVHGYSESAIAERVAEFESLIDWVRAERKLTWALVYLTSEGKLQLKDGAHRASAALALNSAARIRCKIVV